MSVCLKMTIAINYYLKNAKISEYMGYESIAKFINSDTVLIPINRFSIPIPVFRVKLKKNQNRYVNPSENDFLVIN